MSYILDALKKAERDRNLGDVPTIDSQEIPDQELDDNGWKRITAIIVVINILVFIGAYFWLFKSEPEVAVHEQSPATFQAPAMEKAPKVSSEPDSVPAEKPATEAVSSVTEEAVVAPSPARAQTPDAVKKAIPPELPVEKAVPVQATPGMEEQQVVEPAIDATEEKMVVALDEPVEVIVEDDVPDYKDMSFDFRSRIPDIEVNVHVYAEEPARRFVMINMRKYREGNQVSDGLYLEEIRSDALVFNFRGERFKIPQEN